MASTIKNIPTYEFDDNLMVFMEVTLKCMKKGNIPLYNMSPYYGMLFDVLETSNPVIAKKLHDGRKHGESMPWSFGLLNIEHNKTNKKGYYEILENTNGTLIVKTINKDIMDAIAYHHKNDLVIYFNKVPFKITRIEIHDHTYDIPPCKWKTLHLDLHTVTFMRKSGKEIEFTAKNLIEFQIEKLRKMGIIIDSLDFDIDPYVRIVKKYTKYLHLHITSFHTTTQVKPLKGLVGHVVIKVSGSDEIKDFIWNLFKISEFVGIGNRSSMGFGNMSMYVE